MKGRPKNLKDLIICPTCEQQGIIKVLGELEGNEVFKIIRFHKLHKGSTKIVGKHFGVMCGTCGSLVFIKNGK